MRFDRQARGWLRCCQPQAQAIQMRLYDGVADITLLVVVDSAALVDIDALASRPALQGSYQQASSRPSAQV